MGDIDDWLSARRVSSQQMWCSNPACKTYGDYQTVYIETENGVRTASPEECPECGGYWLGDPPEERE